MNYLIAVNRSFKDNPSGSARVAWDIACLARDSGHNVVLLCQSPTLAFGLSRKDKEDGVVVVRFGHQNVKFFQRQQIRRGVGAALNRHLSDFRPDTVHIHSLLIGEAVIASLGRQCKYVATVHSPVVPEARINWMDQGWTGKAKIALGGLERLRRIQNNILQVCERVHVLSEYTQRELKHYCSNLPPVYVIPHWRKTNLVRLESKSQARAALNWSSDEKILFSLRRMVPRMGHSVAIRAISPILEKFNARLIFAGDGPLRQSLQVLSSQVPGGHRISFLGRVSEKDLKMMYSGSDLFILPTTDLECFGLIILEAYSYGCPVLATNVGAISEVIAPLMPEFLVNPNDVSQMRATVASFLSGQLQAPAESQILKYVTEKYDLNDVGPKLMRFLELV